MFDIEGKVFKRTGTYYITLDIKNRGPKVTSKPEHQILIRPRYVTNEDGVSITDPEFGRSDPLDSIDTDEQLTLKFKVVEEEILKLFPNGGDCIISYGVVQEFVKWHEPLCDITVKVDVPEPELVVDTTDVEPGTIADQEVYDRAVQDGKITPLDEDLDTVDTE